MAQGDFDAIVIGGGGAGMVAAWRAASRGAKVLLIERNPRLGTKVRISGGGKCNITHIGTPEEVLRAFIPLEARFLKPSMYRFPSGAVIALLEKEGVPTVARENGRVFPVSADARDVVEAFRRLLTQARVDVMTGVRAERILADEHGVLGVAAPGREFISRQVVLATGGVSYPRTGTTGDGYAWAQALGHDVVPLRPALAPIGVRPSLPPQWRGVAIRNGLLSARSNGRQVSAFAGDILFSHEGVTGPAALEVSREAAAAMEQGDVRLLYDFFPSKDFGDLDGDLNEQIVGQRSRTIGNILEEWLPNRMIPYLLASAGVDPAARGYVLTREQRRSVVRLLKGWEIGDVNRIAIERGEVTAGGVALNQVDPRTMRSRKVDGLLLCGEILDMAGPVGGYNLQAAFSTGFVAGESAGGMEN